LLPFFSQHRILALHSTARVIVIWFDEQEKLIRCIIQKMKVYELSNQLSDTLLTDIAISQGSNYSVSFIVETSFKLNVMGIILFSMLIAINSCLHWHSRQKKKKKTIF
jgi:hypothetical protein